MRLDHEELTRRIIGCAMLVHRNLGPGFLESVYRNAFAHELRKAGIGVECEVPLNVSYDGVIIGQYFADMMVEGVVIIENKAGQCLAAAHEAQFVNYLNTAGVEIGLLFNFGAAKVEFKRKSRVYKPADNPKNPVNPVKESYPMRRY